MPRPFRPKVNWKNENFLGKDPASKNIKQRSVDPEIHKVFSSPIKKIPPNER